MLDIGRIAVMRIVEDECRRDPKYLARIHRNGRVILSDVREMDDAELVKRLRALGLECDRDAIASLAPGMRSAGDLEDELARRAGVTLPDLDDDFAWLALIVLWERWLPDVPNAEMLDESMQRGYQFYEARDGLMAMVEEWARTWEMVKNLSRRFGALSVEVFDRMFPITQCVFNWSSDFEMELGNAEVFNLPCIGRERYMADFDRTFPLSAGHLLPIDGPFDDEALDFGLGSPAASEPRKAKAGRNEPCPCGSGKKFKKCCGR